MRLERGYDAQIVTITKKKDRIQELDDFSFTTEENDALPIY